MLTRDDILKVQLKRKKVYISGLGGEVYIQQQSGAQRAEIEWLSMKITSDKTAFAEMRAMMVIRALVDEDGNPLFTEKDLEAVKNLPGNILETIDDELSKLSKSEGFKEIAKKSTASQ